MKTKTLIGLFALVFLCISAKTLVHPDRVPETTERIQKKKKKKRNWKLGPLFPKRIKQDTTVLPPCDTIELVNRQRLPVRIYGSDGVVLRTSSCEDENRREDIYLEDINYIIGRDGRRVGLEEWGIETSPYNNPAYPNPFTHGMLLGFLSWIGLIILLIVYLRPGRDFGTAILGWLTGIAILFVLAFLILLAILSGL